MKKLIPIVILSCCAGCWTFNESEYPEVAYMQATPEGQKLKIQMADFSVSETVYDPIAGYQTVYVPGYYGRHHYHVGYYETVPVTTYVARQELSNRYLTRAVDLMEKAGFVIAAEGADLTVETTFEGPRSIAGDGTTSFLWAVCSAFLCSYDTQEWSAALRVRDNKTGRLVFHHDYVQRYEANVFSIVPLFGPACCEQTGYHAMKSWCLSALTDRVIADVTAFLQSR